MNEHLADAWSFCLIISNLYFDFHDLLWIISFENLDCSLNSQINGSAGTLPRF